MSSYVPAALLREIRLENYQAPSVSQVSQYRNLLSFIFEFKRLNSQSIFASLSWFEVIKPNLKLIEQMSLSWYHHSPISNLWVPVITDTKFYGWLAPKLVSWGSEATPSATPFFKRTYKISHPKTKSKKTLLLKLGQSFDELAKLGKSIQGTHNRGGWLIL